MPGGLKKLWMLNRVNCDAAERPEPHIYGGVTRLAAPHQEGYRLLIRHVDAIT